jgi:hypothetical protein
MACAAQHALQVLTRPGIVFKQQELHRLMIRFRAGDGKLGIINLVLTRDEGCRS